MAEDSFAQSNREGQGSLGNAVLLHARVYSFAHRFFVDELKQFALRRLMDVLTQANDTPECLFPYLTEAICHVYDKTPPTDFGEDPAEKFFSQFVALNYTTFTSEDLDSLITQGGEFSLDISHKLARRLITSDACIKSLENEVRKLQEKSETLQLTKKGLQTSVDVFS